jgi:hypothetical protein
MNMERLLKWLSRSHFGFFRLPLPTFEDGEVDQEALETADTMLEEFLTHVAEAEKEVREELGRLVDESDVDEDYLRELGESLEVFEEHREVARRMRGECADIAAGKQLV